MAQVRAYNGLPYPKDFDPTPTRRINWAMVSYWFSSLIDAFIVVGGVSVLITAHEWDSERLNLVGAAGIVYGLLLLKHRKKP